jgi:hypothetical protein
MEEWVRKHFMMFLNYDVCRALWHCLHGRALYIEIREADKTWDENISYGDQFNSETLARLLAEKEKKVFIDRNVISKKLIESGKYPALKKALGPPGWFIRNPDPTKYSQQPVVPNPMKVKQDGSGWKEGHEPPDFYDFPDPTDPSGTVRNPRYNDDEYNRFLQEFDIQSKALHEEAMATIKKAVASGAAHYKSDTFEGCSKPPAATLQKVIQIAQSTAKRWENNKQLMKPPGIHDK